MVLVPLWLNKTNTIEFFDPSFELTANIYELRLVDNNCGQFNFSIKDVSLCLNVVKFEIDLNCSIHSGSYTFEIFNTTLNSTYYKSVTKIYK
jgi:hypothetical protein